MDVFTYISQNGKNFWHTLDDHEDKSPQYRKTLAIDIVAYASLYKHNLLNKDKLKKGILDMNDSVSRNYNIPNDVFLELKDVAKKCGRSINELVVSAIQKEVLWRKIQETTKPKTLTLNEVTKKYEPDDEYFEYMIKEFFDNIIPLIDFDFVPK